LPVYLDPVTPYSIEWFNNTIAPGDEIESGAERGHRPDPVQWIEGTAFLSYRKTTRADAEANFRFEGVAPGDYFITCLIVAPGSRHKGGWAYSRITVGSEETVRTIVTRPSPGEKALQRAIQRGLAPKNSDHPQ
jgi:hypothetical protein